MWENNLRWSSHKKLRDAVFWTVGFYHICTELCDKCPSDRQPRYQEEVTNIILRGGAKFCKLVLSQCNSMLGLLFTIIFGVCGHCRIYPAASCILTLPDYVHSGVQIVILRAALYVNHHLNNYLFQTFLIFYRPCIYHINLKVTDLRNVMLGNVSK